MILPLDQLIYQLEQVIQQLDALEAALMAFPVEKQNPPPVHQSVDGTED